MNRLHDALDISEVENFTLEKMLAIPQDDTAHGGKIRVQFFKRPCSLTLKPRYYSISITGTEERQCADVMPELFRVKIKILKDKIQT